jgi:peptidoglycan hydrolase-like protein with peptidoglycan-binding domain
MTSQPSDSPYMQQRQSRRMPGDPGQAERGLAIDPVQRSGIRRHLRTFICVILLVLALPYAGTALGQTASELSRSEVREIQTTLKGLGYDAGPSDGLLGPRTRSAIQAFRAANGFDTESKVSEQLLQRLRAAVERADETQQEVGSASQNREGRQDEPAAPGGDTGAPDQPSPETDQAVGSENAKKSDAKGNEAAALGEASESAPDGSNTADRDDEPAGPELVGTRWIFEDENGATMRLTFRSGGQIERDGVIANAWQWDRSGKSVTITYDSGIGLSATRRGHLTGPDRMRGTGTSPSQDDWAWTARRTKP